MRGRQIYYRRKGKTIAIEGKQNKKSLLIWTLPNDPEQLIEILAKASFFKAEKQAKIEQKIKRLDFRTEKVQKQAEEIQTTKIMRTESKDAFSISPDDMIADVKRANNIK